MTDWPKVRLGDVARIQGGHAFKSAEYGRAGHYVVRIANVLDGKVRRTDETFIEIAPGSQLSRFVLNRGDLLMTLTGNIGRTALVDEGVLPAALNQRVARLESQPQFLDRDFLRQTLGTQLFKDHVAERSRGAAQQNISTKDVGDYEFPLPPLDEQKRIVAKLDQAQRQIDQLTSNLDLQLAAVGDFGRAAVNEQIKQGQLPEGDLRSSDLDISSTADRVTGGWPIVPISSVCRVDWGNTKLTKKSYVEDGKFLAVSAAGGDGRIGHAEHAANTPVLSAIGANCGRIFLPTEDFTAIKNTITLTPALGVTTGDFLFHLMQSIQLPIRGAGQPFISKGDIQEFEVSLPPLDEQKRIVAKLDEVQQELAALRGTLDKRRSLALSFRERTLAAAFASDL